MTGPPAPLRRLVAWLAPPDLKATVVDDLDELFERRAAARGAYRARLWYARQTLSALWYLLTIRVRRTSFSTPREGHMGAFDKLVQDCRLAVRLMTKYPGSAAAAILTLGLCIGATTAIFSLVQAVLLRPLPYADPERLIAIWSPRGGVEMTHLSLQEILGYQQAGSLQQVAGYIEHNATFADGDEPERVRAATVSPNLIATLGVAPYLGRGFLPEDSAPGAPTTIVLSHSLWSRQFGARPDIVGASIRVSGTPRTVVGVMPDGFQLPFDYRAARPTEAWLPMAIDPANLGQWGWRSILGIARLKEGAAPPLATSEFALLGDRWIRAGFVADQGDGSMRRRAVPLTDLITGNARRAVVIVFAAVIAVLLIACATVANLLIARADIRRSEIALRAALGADRVRIARQLLTESMAIAISGGALGLLVAHALLGLLKTIPATTVPRAEDVAISSGVLLFCSAVALGTGLLFGLLPTLQLSRPDLSRVLNAARRTAAARGTGRLRRALVITQLTVAVILVLAAGLLVRSLLQMYRIELGFNPSHVLTAHTFLPVPDYPTDGDVVRTFRELERRLETLPGVVAAGAVRVLPLAREIGDWSIVIEGRPHIREENPNTDYQSATPGYFAAMGIQLLRGRLFTHADDENAPMVVVINDTMAERYWPGEDPIGRRFHLSTAEVPWLTIIGIVRTVRHNAVIETPRAEAYLPHAQLARELGSATRAMTLVMRTDGDPLRLAAAMRSAVREVDRHLPLAEMQTMEHVTSVALAQPRLSATLVGAFALLALLLASLGVYSTISLLVSERTREIGIRLALGADGRSILRLILREGTVLVGSGLVLGTAGAAIATRLLQGLLYGVEPLDPLTFAAVPAVLGAVALLACLNPGQRALRVDPAIALRQG